MNEVRLTLISSATAEYPDNTNTDFKIRLAEPVHLKTDERWHAAMASLSTPNSPATYMKAIDVKRTDTLFAYGCRILNPKFADSDPKHIDDILERRMTVGEVFRETALDNYTGVEFWSRIVITFEHMQTWHMFRNVDKNDYWAQSFDDERVCIDVDPARERARVVASNSASSPAMFGLNLTVAKYFGLVEEVYPGQFKPGRNAFYEAFNSYSRGRSLHLLKYNIETDMKANQKGLAVRAHPDTGEKLVYFSRHLNWWFDGVNRPDASPPAATVDDKTRERTRLAMVYCDVVESTLVGNQKHALLRELTLHDSGGSRRSVEPIHYQWLPVRNNVIEVVHVQLADADGNFLTLPSGKTMLTVLLKRA